MAIKHIHSIQRGIPHHRYIVRDTGFRRKKRSGRRRKKEGRDGQREGRKERGKEAKSQVERESELSTSIHFLCFPDCGTRSSDSHFRHDDFPNIRD